MLKIILNTKSVYEGKMLLFNHIWSMRKLWIIAGLFSLVCVENINMANRGCPPIYDVFLSQLEIDGSIIDKLCRTEYYMDDSSGDYSGSGSGDNSKPVFKSVCSFECEEYTEFCPLLSKKLHYTMVYLYDDIRWKYTDVLHFCKKWDYYYYEYEPETTTPTIPSTTTETIHSTLTINQNISTTDDKLIVDNEEETYSKGGTIGILTIMGILLGSALGITIYLCKRR